MSLEMQIEGLQKESKHFFLKSKEKNMKSKKRTFVIFRLNVCEEKALIIFIFKPHIFFIFNPF
jgi:hypothetical protein